MLSIQEIVTRDNPSINQLYNTINYTIMKKFNVLFIVFFVLGMMISGVVRAQWSLQTNPLSGGDSAMLGKIQFVSDTEGWIACGSNGSLLHTTNSGSTWNIVTPFPNDAVGNMSDPGLSMSWANSTHGWAIKTFGGMNIPNGAVLYNTVDGGTIWNRKVFPNSVTTFTYSNSDLQGTWELSELIAAKNADNVIIQGGNTNSSSWAGWIHGLLSFDANGNGTVSEMTKSDGNTDFPSSVSMSISPMGEITIDGDFHGFMSTDKNMVYFTMTDGGGGYVMGVMQKKNAGITFNPADLQGTWQMHSLITSNPESTNKKAEWMYGTITMDANGSGSATFVRDDGSESQNLALSISSEGVITMNGTDFYGFMSADKKSVTITMTEGNSEGYNLINLQKEISGINYATANLQGRWQTHVLSTIDPSGTNLNQQSNWQHGIITLNGLGQGQGDFVNSNSNNNNPIDNPIQTKSKSNNNDQNNSISLSIAQDGIVTINGNNAHGYMSSDKNTILLTMTEENGNYSLAVMQKDLSISGDVGLQVQFADVNTGWVSIYNMIYGNFQLYKTTDGGATWNPLNTNAGGFYQFVDASNGWMVGSSENLGQGTLNSIFHTTDGGSTWTAQATDIGNAKALYFSDLLHGWVVGKDGLVLKTTDGGINWNTVGNTGLTTGSDSKAVFFLDANTGWISVGYENTEGVGTRFILATKNGGLTWATQQTPVTNDIFSIFFPNAENGWLTSDYGQIARYIQPRTIDISAGGLSTALTPTEKSTLTSIAITGNIDARDFKTMRDDMPLLSSIDLNGANIVAYTGSEGTYSTVVTDYPANTTPRLAFYNKTGLTSVTLPATLAAIGRSSFNKCSGLTSINIPSTVSSIGYAAFNYCSGLSLVNIPSSVNLIDTFTFAYCTNLKNISLPTTVTKIGYGAFDYSGLTNITLPDGLNSIGQYAFQNCSSLNSVAIPSTLSTIGYCAFTFDNALTSFQVAGDNNNFSSMDGVLFDHDQKKLLCYPGGKGQFYQIPDGVTVVDTAAFEGLNIIQHVNIPASVTTLSQEAFYWCPNLNSIEIPSTVTSIGGYAFYNCFNLRSINANSGIPVDLSASDSVFKYVDKNNCTLNVPAGSKALYQAANQWKDFVNIMEMNSGLYTYSQVNPKLYYIIGLGDEKWNASPEGLGVSYYPMSLVDGNQYDSNGNGVFTYTGYFTTERRFKLIGGTLDWNEQWGNKDTRGIDSPVHNDTYSSDFLVPSNGYYTITLNSITNNLTISPIAATPTVYGTMGLIGSFSSWSSDTNMIPTESANNHEWYTTCTFDANGECKFRANGIWDTNWGANIYPYGIGVHNGPNIPYSAGTYTIFLNDIDGTYYFIKQEAPGTVDLQNGLVAYYPFNGNANDESGNANNGTVYGATLTQDRNGNANSAYSFDGVNDYITIDGIIDDLYQSDKYSVTGWFRHANSMEGEAIFSVNRETDIVWGQNISMIFTAQNSLTYYADTLANNNYYYPPLTTNEWHFFALTIDKNNVSKLYADNYLVCQEFVNKMSMTPISKASLGQEWDNGESGGGFFSQTSQHFNGQIDDVRIYNRVINSNEIKTLFNGLLTNVVDQGASNYNFYPNPVSDGFRVKGLEGNALFSLYDLNGQLLITKTIAAGSYISLNTLPKGMYVAKIITSNGTVEKKLVKK